MSAKAYGEGLSQSSLLSALYVECRPTHVNLRRQLTMLACGMAPVSMAQKQTRSEKLRKRTVKSATGCGEH